jgi:hypothetical protein
MAQGSFLYGVINDGFTITLNPNRARGHYGRDGMLVDHLAHRVLEQYNELVIRLNAALQLDAIDQKNRNRNTLFTQHIQEWVLQMLAFHA